MWVAKKVLYKVSCHLAVCLTGKMLAFKCLSKPSMSGGIPKLDFSDLGNVKDVTSKIPEISAIWYLCHKVRFPKMYGFLGFIMHIGRDYKTRQIVNPCFRFRNPYNFQIFTWTSKFKSHCLGSQPKLQVTATKVMQVDDSSKESPLLYLTVSRLLVYRMERTPWGVLLQDKHW